MRRMMMCVAAFLAGIVLAPFVAVTLPFAVALFVKNEMED